MLQLDAAAAVAAVASVAQKAATVAATTNASTDAASSGATSADPTVRSHFGSSRLVQHVHQRTGRSPTYHICAPCAL